MRSTPQVTYPVIGALLGALAPAGSFLWRLLAFRRVRERPWADLRKNGFFYLYDLVGTSMVFAAMGYIAGRRVERLRRGEAFYHELAEHDGLTGLYNGRAFTDRYRRALDRAVAAKQPLAVILLDVDQLKAINDAFGHPAGSQALVHVADGVRRSKRAADIAARWGGDEFAILLEGADEAAAMRVAEGVISFLRTSPLMLERTPVTVSVTIGICTAAQPSAPTDLFVAADRALLGGKSHGRNTIEIVSI
jgi:two-component system cell cycle response regulator